MEGKPTGFPDELNIKYERERGIEDLLVFGLGNQENKTAIS